MQFMILMQLLDAKVKTVVSNAKEERKLRELKINDYIKSMNKISLKAMIEEKENIVEINSPAFVCLDFRQYHSF